MGNEKMHLQHFFLLAGAPNTFTTKSCSLIQSKDSTFLKLDSLDNTFNMAQGPKLGSW